MRTPHHLVGPVLTAQDCAAWLPENIRTGRSTTGTLSSLQMKAGSCHRHQIVRFYAAFNIIQCASLAVSCWMTNTTLTVVNWDEFVQPIIRHYVHAVRTGFLLFPGSSQPHAAQVCKQCLDVEGADCPLTGPHLHQSWIQLWWIQHCQTATCPGAQWYPDPCLWRDPAGHDPISDQKPRGCWDWMQLHRGTSWIRLWFQFWTLFFYVFVFFLVCARWIEQSKSAKIFTLNISFIKTRCVCYLFYSFFEQFLCIIFVLCYFRHKVLNIWIWNSRLLNFILMCLYRKIQWSHPWGGSISTQNRKPYWRLRIWATTRLHPSSPSRTYILLRLCVHRELISDSLDLASFS